VNDNGDAHEHEPESPIAELVASIEVCAGRSEMALEEARAARHASERTERMVGDLGRTLQRVTDDHLEMRTGVPTGWRARAGLVAACVTSAAIIGAVVARLAG
jgi:hypothetical protein